MPENKGDGVIKPFLDEAGRLRQYPSKRGKQLAVLKYMAGKLEPGREYTEKEINGLIDEWHTFGDHCMLRRDMFDAGLLDREPDGSRYRLSKKDAENG